MMDWLVRPLATMFLGGALGASSRSINLADSASAERVSGIDKLLYTLFLLGAAVIRARRWLTSNLSSRAAA